MTRFIEFIISLLIVAALFVVIALFLPARRVYSHQIETNRPMTTVFDTLNGFQRVKDWNALVKRDPRMQITLSGAESGVGAKFDYASSDRVIGNGSWEIVESVPGELIRYKLSNNARGADKEVSFLFDRTGQRKQNVEVTEFYEVSYGWDLLGRYAGLYVSSNVGEDIKHSLDQLTNLMVTIPKFDYSKNPEPYAVADLPMQDVLVVTTAAKRENEAISTAMENQLKWIQQVMENNGLEANGPLRVVTNEFTADSYGFDIVMPVRKRGAVPAAPVDAGAPADGSEAPAAAADTGPVVAAGAPLAVKLEGPVVYAQLPARKVVSTGYTGPAPALPQIRDMARAWAMVHGFETDDRPYEEYLVPISQIYSDDAKFKVYWPLKNK